MTYETLARKLDQCLAAQVNMQQERDALARALRVCESFIADNYEACGYACLPQVAHDARAALAQIKP